ncbi:MAG: hypothetical protein AVDCRST_MAG70-1098 [uncultured Thermomicrobiales bacterium]|uniref:Restriction endonuclease type IV Mrr domain-containing protein n=1 Tax=uncultured Thermomicrobiales bacterium TaxID=1645740 RepID=A0A6J4UPV7_9BACT|nr:MAG: hypothetical protein AVDCRST_MAG70-1098 [uncultured Thermomicrobiales bacterium]
MTEGPGRGEAVDRRVKKPSPGSNDAKGRLVEQIAAWLHESPGVNIQVRVMLPTLSNPGRKREFDVLLTGQLAGDAVRVAIECKNEGQAIGVEPMDAFVGKLQDAGIPSRHGVYVSASGYTSGAVERAAAAGIQPLVLEGLTQDRLAMAVREAYQSVIYLLVDLTGVTIESTDPDELLDQTDMHWMFPFRDEAGAIVGSVYDLVWDRWRAGDPPSILGVYRQSLTVPPDWRYVNADRVVPIAVAATVRVLGLVITMPGQAEEVALLDPVTRADERNRFRLSFDVDQSAFPVKTVRTDEELEQHLFAGLPPWVVEVGRIRLPRIRVFHKFYWPPSERFMKAMDERGRALLDAGVDPSATFERTFMEIEGPDLTTIWDSIWEGHPAAHEE